MNPTPTLMGTGSQRKMARCALRLPSGAPALLGYACVNLTLGRSLRTLRLATLRARGVVVLREIIEHNMTLLADVLDWNQEQGIAMYRLSSDLIPFGSHPEVDLDEIAVPPILRDRIALHANHARLSMHPAQFTVLSTPDAEVLVRSRAELSYHAALLDHLGVVGGDIILHGGGVYGDRDAARDRLLIAIQNLPEPVRRRLCLENDERSWSVLDLLPICESAGIPLVVDTLHHALNGHSTLAALPWHRIAATWTLGLGARRPKVHYSEQDPAKRPGAHTAAVTADDLLTATTEIGLEAYDIMLECKDKDRALLGLVDDLQARGALAADAEVGVV